MTFRQFWPLYLQAHRHPRTRIAHYCATGLAFAAIAVGLALRQPLIPLAAIAFSYVIAIASHRLFEHNHSLVTVNAAWGALADLKMCWLALTGQLTADLERHAPHMSTETTPQELGARLSGC